MPNTTIRGMAAVNAGIGDILLVELIKAVIRKKALLILRNYAKIALGKNVMLYD